MNHRHPQAPPFADQAEIEAFLARPLLARLCTHNKDGTIHVTPIFYLYQNGEFLLGTQALSRRIKNIRNDARVSVLVDASEPDLQAVLVYGEARLDFEDVVNKRVEILTRYYDTPDKARAFAEKLASAWQTVIIHVHPTRWVTFDYTKPFSID